jgi:hypothetical protein
MLLSAQGVQSPAARASFPQDARLFEDRIWIANLAGIARCRRSSAPAGPSSVMVGNLNVRRGPYRSKPADSELIVDADAELYT